MFRNFFKTTLRNLAKNKSYVVINVLGLSLSLACCIVGYINYKYAADFDSNHQYQDRIYKIQVNKSVQNRTVPYGITPLALGKAIRGQFTGVEEEVRVTRLGLVLKKDDQIFDENIAFADEAFFDMFTYPFKHGSREAFLDRSNIILSEETADKYFGDINPVGEFLTMIDDKGDRRTMRVGGVLEKIPNNTSITLDALTHFDNIEEIVNSKDREWKLFVAGTFIRTTDNQYPEHVVKELNDQYIQVQNEARDNWKVASYYLEPLTTLGKNAEDIRSNWLNEPPPPPAVFVPFIMAIFMLLIACFNFTNTSIAISSKRLKEIGVRKVMGGSRSQLIVQFMGENLVLCFLSLLVGLLVSYFLVPAYASMWPFLDFDLNLVDNYEIYVFLFILLFFTAIVAGAYPSLYVSAYRPVSILRGNQSLGKTGILSKALLAFQYTLTAIALIASLAFSENALYQRGLDVGFEKTNVISVRLETPSEYDKFRSAISSNPNIEAIAGTEEHIGRWNYTRTLHDGKQEIEANMMDMGVDYLGVMDLKMIEGRYFREDLREHDLRNSIVVNEMLVEEMGWEKPLGKTLRIDDSTRLEVIGVMKNFYMDGFWDPLEPLGIRPAKDKQMNFVVARVKPGKLTTTFNEMEKAWYEVEPDRPFNGDYQDEFIRDAERVNENIVTMFSFIGVLALLLSTIGLFTLVSLNILKRVKEIGVRKVLGATIPHILGIMNRQFVWIMMIAAILGSGLSFLAIDLLMASVFAYYKAISFFTLALPLSLLLFVAFSVSSGRIWSAAMRNPVDSLRYE
ncbi:MAG: ABC transporter permease [Cyclobacteriaceae bacterium]|nr:ABC transporter permease [Cyclobacteriaceae bacterium HetDA_MAG_MS6]